MSDKFQLEQQEKQIFEPEALPVVNPDPAGSMTGTVTPIELDQYIDYDSECSAIFGDREIEAAKRLTKGG